AGAASGRPRSPGARTYGPSYPSYHDRPSCPWTPHRDPCGSWAGGRRGPAAGRGCAAERSPACLVDLLNGHQVRHHGDHAPDLGLVLLDDDLTDTTEAQRTQRLALALVA